MPSHGAARIETEETGRRLDRTERLALARFFYSLGHIAATVNVGLAKNGIRLPSLRVRITPPPLLLTVVRAGQIGTVIGGEEDVDGSTGAMKAGESVVHGGGGEQRID